MTVKKGRQELPERQQTLSDAALQARREYYKKYYRRNAEKRRAYNQNHWERVAAQQAERQED